MGQVPYLRREVLAASDIECMIWDRAKGKVTERHEVGGPGAFADKSDAELLAEVKAFLTEQK